MDDKVDIPTAKANSLMIALAYILLIIGLYLIGWSLWGLPDIFVIMQERKAAERVMERAFQYKQGLQQTTSLSAALSNYSNPANEHTDRPIDAEYVAELDVTHSRNRVTHEPNEENLDLYSSLEAYEAGLNEEPDPEIPYLDPETAEWMDMLEDPPLEGIEHAESDPSPTTNQEEDQVSVRKTEII